MVYKKFLVIGLGPSGGILAAYLARAGHQVWGVDTWEEHAGIIEKSGLVLTGCDTIEIPLWKVETQLDRMSGTDFDFLVLAVKTPNLAPVLTGLKSFTGRFQVVVLQNGLDNEQEVARFVPRERVLRVAVNYAGNIDAPGRIRMNFFQKPNQVGCACGDTGCDHAGELAEILSSAGLETEDVCDIRKFTWKKTILNAILAPIAALLEVTMADVMNHPGGRETVEALIRESIAVATAAGYDFGEDFFDTCVEFLLKAGRHKPSMLIDIEQGRPTEIDFINGKIAEQGRALGIPVPYNTTMTNLVKARDFYNRRS